MNANDKLWREDRGSRIEDRAASSTRSSMDDPRVVEALEQYLAAIEAGEKPNQQAFLARHAGIADALAMCLQGMEALHEEVSASQQPPDEASPAEWQPEASLGDFRIIREIGRGGMGVVYEAMQLSLGRRVALKVLPFAAALDTKQLQRFRNEAQAAAHLHHTNIVPVYAVGCERGVHFYAMQLIEGQNLAALVRDLRGRESVGDPAAQPTGPYVALPSTDGQLQPEQERTAIAKVDTLRTLGAQLSTQRSGGSFEFFRTIARLMVQAAEGIDYAHGMGIIHRDVKPANLLVDERGNLWITDFGLAQFHAEGGLTQSGDMLGTLRYMSPEQAGGPRVLIDHRTDVYSLGVTLYELLTLRPIFDGTDRQTLLQQILHEEPRSPRSLDRSIPPELETIVLKAVAKVPSERYATARDFAEDLQRFLRDEPIRARRPTLVQRSRKWLRRHPSVPVAAAVLLVLLTACSLVAAWLIQGEQEKTRQAFERERQRAELAEDRFRLARRPVDEMIDLAEELADNPHMEGLRRRLLETALDYYEEFMEQRRDDPDAQAELATTQTRVQKILEDLAVLQGAGKLLLLTEGAVLDDVQATAEQRGRITELSRQLSEQRQASFHAFHRLTTEERGQRFLELARANESAVAMILTYEQQRRLQQIALQLKGPAGFLEMEVAATLKLTADQKERIRAIEAEVFLVKMPELPNKGWPGPGSPGGPGGKRPHDPPRGGPGGSRKPDPKGGRPGGPSKSFDSRSAPPPNPAEIHEYRLRVARDKILAELTEEQVKQWKEMTGEPFRGAVSVRPPARSGPR